MKKRGGLLSTTMSILGSLLIIGIILAVLTQFGGNIGALFRWILDTAWSIVSSVRDAVLSWDLFQSLF